MEVPLGGKKHHREGCFPQGGSVMAKVAGNMEKNQRKEVKRKSRKSKKSKKGNDGTATFYCCCAIHAGRTKYVWKEEQKSKSREKQTAV